MKSRKNFIWRLNNKNKLRQDVTVAASRTRNDYLAQLLTKYGDSKYIPRTLLASNPEYETDDKAMICLRLDATVESEAREAFTEFKQLYQLDVEKDLTHKYRHNQVDQIKPVREDWLSDPTGTDPVPTNELYYDADNKPKPSCYALRSLQKEMYFRIRANFMRLLGDKLKKRVATKIKAAEQEKTGLTSDNRHTRAHRLSWETIENIVIDECVPNTGGFYHRQSWQLQRPDAMSLKDWYDGVAEAIKERDDEFPDWKDQELEDWVACFVRWTQPDERTAIRDKTNWAHKNLYALTWKKITAAIKKIDSSTFSEFRRSRCPQALHQTLVAASEVIAARKNSRGLRTENTTLKSENKRLKKELERVKRGAKRRQPNSSRNEPAAAAAEVSALKRPSRASEPCYKCLRDKLGKQMHNPDECTSEWRAHIIAARKKNHEKQLRENARKEKSGAARSSTPDESDWRNNPCPYCTGEGVKGKLAIHPRHDLCIRHVMTEQGIKDPAKRKVIMKEYFAAVKKREKYPLMETFKQNLSRKRKGGNHNPQPKKKSVSFTGIGEIDTEGTNEDGVFFDNDECKSSEPDFDVLEIDSPTLDE